MRFIKFTIGKQRYAVYENGLVYSFQKNRWLHIFGNGTGYKNVKLWDGSKTIIMYLHILVATHFIANPENKPEVNHKDGNKENNHFSNLEWNTRLENMTHAYDSGLFSEYRRIQREERNRWVGLSNSTRTILAVTDIHNKTGNYKVLTRCKCSNELLMYFNDFQKDKQNYCAKCRPKSSYS